MEERIVQFVRALRSKGVRVSLAESSDAMRAIEALGVQKLGNFRLSLRTTLIKNSSDLRVFDELFPLFFSADSGPPMTQIPDDLSAEEAENIAQALGEFNRRLREMLEKLLRGEELTPDQLKQLSSLVGLDFADDPRYQDWMARRMERAMQFPQIQEAIRDMMAILAEMGMDSDRLDQIREVMQENLESIREQIHRHAGKQIAENMTDSSRDEGVDSLMDRPFSSLSDADMDRLRREVSRLAAVLRTRIALRQKRGKTGQLDAKATLRANMKHRGVPFNIKFKERRLKPKLVVICDISTSMRQMSELMLSLSYSLQDLVTKMHSFAFIDHLEYISPDFMGNETQEAVQQVLLRMPPGYYSTDLGFSLENFHKEYFDTLDQRTTLILVGDGRNNYNNPRVDLFSEMARRTSRTIWLVPEPAYLWGSGDSDMLKYTPFCDDVLQVSTLGQLSEAVDSLLSN